VVSDQEVRQCLTDEEVKALEEGIKMGILKDPKFIQCHCGEIVEIMAGKPEYETKDDKGNKISREAAEHMGKNRIRCHAC